MRVHRLSILFITSAALLCLVYSCQKEPNVKIDDKKVFSSKDPKALSSAIKVWHGVRTQGTPPPEKGNTLQLDNSGFGPVYAIAGRYAIIQPEVIFGDVSGYYLKLNGAPDYFKVDYTKPRIVARQAKPRKSGSFLRLDSSGGNLDSAIVIVLPADLKVPDTICMTYWAYDATGNVSNPVDVCIIINSLGTDAGGSWLNGVWRYSAAWDNSSYDTVVYNKWMPSAYGGYYCDSGMLQWSDQPLPGQSFLFTDSSFYRKADLSFGTNGGLKYELDDSWKTLDYNSNCSNLVATPVQTQTEIFTGAWSYNSSANKLVIVFEFDDTGLPVEEAYEFNLIKVNNKNLLLVDNTDPAEPEYSRFEKL
jgi:hypothetical protein